MTSTPSRIPTSGLASLNSFERAPAAVNMASGGWGWGNLFGGSAKSQKDTTKNAILGLRGTADMLTKREKHLVNQMEEQDNLARKNVNTNKTGELGIWRGDRQRIKRQ